ncbi:hypothetical protein [Paenibacillus rhizolycopersici]|uniref:hypothetical protein n=1 Tax=Paenibacillus rhizolycopersici TaxID=2780073 RepID=UPI003D27571B
MNMQIRIAAKDDFASEFARALVGAKRTEGHYPKFIFQNDVQRDEYDRIRRRLEEENGRDGVHSNGTQSTETPGGQYKGRVGRNYAQNNRRFSRARTL